MADPTWLTTESIEEVGKLLHSRNLLLTNEQVIHLSIAGEGNMNVTLRVELQDESAETRSLIVKQSRPYVAKYDSIPAPLDRIHFEAKFYDFVQQEPSLSRWMPKMEKWVDEEYVMVLEDLGQSSDATCLYNNAQELDFLPELLNWLSDLHERSTNNVDPEQFQNLELRKLNHAHIFDLPFQDPPIIDLDEVCPGLAVASAKVRASKALRDKCLELGAVYLSQGECLLHGDFYPGSWLLTDEGPKVIDPEFCFVGCPEFDFGVLHAHLQLAGVKNPGQALHEHFATRQTKVSSELVEQFAAVEVLRRLLGVAQLPLTSSIDERTQLIESAYKTLV